MFFLLERHTAFKKEHYRKHELNTLQEIKEDENRKLIMKYKNY